MTSGDWKTTRKQINARTSSSTSAVYTVALRLCLSLCLSQAGFYRNGCTDRSSFGTEAYHFYTVFRGNSGTFREWGYTFLETSSITPNFADFFYFLATKHRSSQLPSTEFGRLKFSDWASTDMCNTADVTQGVSWVVLADETRLYETADTVWNKIFVFVNTVSSLRWVFPLQSSFATAALSVKRLVLCVPSAKQ